MKTMVYRSPNIERHHLLKSFNQLNLRKSYDDITSIPTEEGKSVINKLHVYDYQWRLVAFGLVGLYY